MAKIPKVIFLTGCDFANYPFGGALSFAKHMMKSFGNKLALVGVTTDETPVGQWVKKEIEGISYHFFSIGKRNCTSVRKPLIPVSLRYYCAFAQYKNSILSIGIRNAFAGDGLSLVAVRNWSWDSLCGCIHGIRNPFDRPRYCYGKLFAHPWYNLRLSAMNRADVVFIAADDTEIDDFVNQTNGRVDRKHLIHYGTRVNTDIFKPALINSARYQFSGERDTLIVVTCGRISWVKGWDLILDSFQHLHLKRPSPSFLLME